MTKFLAFKHVECDKSMVKEAIVHTQEDKILWEG